MSLRDAIEWIDDQPWSNGKIGAWGSSGTAIAMYVGVGATPPALDCAFLQFGCANFYQDQAFTGGMFRQALIEGWLESQEALDFLDEFVGHSALDAWWDVLELEPRPVIQLDDTLTERPLPGLAGVEPGSSIRVEVVRVVPRAGLLTLRRVD